MKTWWGWSLGCGTAPKLWPLSPNQDTGTCWDPLVHAPPGVPRGSTTESQGMERASWGGEFSDWNCMLYKSSPFNQRPNTHTHNLSCNTSLSPSLKHSLSYLISTVAYVLSSLSILLTVPWQFWGSGSLVKSKQCHYVMIEPDNHLNHCFLHP